MTARGPASASLVKGVPGALFHACAVNVTEPFANCVVSMFAIATVLSEEMVALATMLPLRKTSTF